ncbi:SDR family NAD(P)-dependent oxidoreductase [Govanella unica]|uniref:SDR family NAD(P)-dependent oxidoreductase n=1 Tax=Govanella unica TaxID=2975056 RepID=A0A9X3TXQ1_9PROT|nr:SDR family NAD(P)-dependent oxidoreductase [Govania unica]MDA5193524.1 SDR family NAD(P)-dependent oxidoreductase [Govania unica]
MNAAMLLKIIKFYGRFMPSFTAIGYYARAPFWPAFTTDLTGQTWVVTGASGGVGGAITREAARRGATVLAIARSAAKLDALVASFSGKGKIIPYVADLALQSSTTAVAERLIAEGRKIDVLQNNVGLLLDDYIQTSEGRETSFATNILNQFLLTERLLDADMFAPGAAVINMASGGMYNAPLTLARMNAPSAEKYSGVYAYAVHKRGQAELVKYWQAKYGHKGMNFYVMHPGWSDTDGVKTAMPRFRRILQLVLRNEAQGADTAVWLGATRPKGTNPAGFWLDRKPRDAHAYDYTKVTKHTPEELADYLRAELAKQA